MWNSLVNSLEKAGDQLSKAATNAGKTARLQQEAIATPKASEGGEGDVGGEGARPDLDDCKASTSPTAGSGTSPTAGAFGSSRFLNMNLNTDSFLPKNMPKFEMPNIQLNIGKGETDGATAGTDSEGISPMARPDPNEVLKNFQAGWSTVVELSTKQLKEAQENLKVASEKTSQSIRHASEQTSIQWKQAQEKIKVEQNKIFSKAKIQYYKRAVHLPLDVEALKDAQVVYLTDRLITMSHPAMDSTVHGDISAERKLAAIGHLLQKRHEGRFMVWNLSEVDYDIDILEDQVLTFSFPGSPSPPLGLLLKLLMSMESWLKADPRNVAVVHCLTGKGRTSTVTAAFLCWMGEAGFCDIQQALEYIARCKQTTVEELTIPSQRRYATYFKNMLDNVRPSQPPLLLKRIILSEAPRFAKGPPLNTATSTTTTENTATAADGAAAESTTTTTEKKEGSAVDDEILRLGCAPYLQLFKSGDLLFTAPATLNRTPNNPNELPFCQVADGTITFLMDTLIQGDILVRCRHLSSNRRQRISMFRAAFHTGYAPQQGMMRLTKAQLDGACQDDRFPDDFFVDLIFEKVTIESLAAAAAAEKSSEATKEGAEGTSAETETNKEETDDVDAAHKTSTTVKASSYDTMLHRDSRFWDVIAERRKEQQEKQAADAAAATAATTAPDSTEGGGEAPNATAAATAANPMWGPTVGRRRDFNKTKTEDTAGADGATNAKTNEGKAALQTFSIGGEFDFLPDAEELEAAKAAAAKAAAATRTKKSTKPKKDSLMEALMGALDEELDAAEEEHHGIEEIVFHENNDPRKKTAMTPEPAPTIVALPPKGGETTTTAATATATTPSHDENKKAPEQQSSTAAASSGGNDMDDILANAEMDDSMNALLGDDGNNDVADMDDAELADLENFLSSKK